LICINYKEGWVMGVRKMGDGC